MVWCCVVVWFGLAWFGKTWFGFVSSGLAWFGSPGGRLLQQGQRQGGGVGSPPVTVHYLPRSCSAGTFSYSTIQIPA